MIQTAIRTALLAAATLALTACPDEDPGGDPDAGTADDADALPGDPDAGITGDPDAGGGATTTVVLTATAGAVVQSTLPDDPAPADRLLVQNYTAQLARSYLRFDVSSIPAGATVESAKLELYYCVCDGIDDIGVAAAAGAWNPATLTWKNQPGVAGDPVDVVNLNPAFTSNYSCGDTGSWVAEGGTYASKPGWYVTPVVQAWVDGAAADGLVLAAAPELDDPDPPGRLYAVFAGDVEAGPCPATPPRLVVTYR